MSCSKHFLGFNWEHHNWERQVTQYVCSDCGKVMDGYECICEPERGERCPIRLEFLASQRGSTVAGAAAEERSTP
jgi:hypothetical protein